MKDIKNVTVIGAGLMGHGIAQVFAVAGKSVTVFDQVPGALASLKERIARNLAQLDLDDSALSRVTACGDLAQAVAQADFVVEAVAENLEVKRGVFKAVEAACPPDAILASNTSVIAITEIMEVLSRRERGLGTHWWNPPFLVPLVEVIRTKWTAPEAVAAAIELHTSIGQSPVDVLKDVPGFVGNRLQHALWREAMNLVEAGICDADTVDMVIKAGFGRRLAVLGPLENADLVGTDLTLAAHRYLLPDLKEPPGVVPCLERLVAEGRLGFKTGRGFRSWTPEQQDALRKRLVDHLKMLRNAEKS